MSMENKSSRFTDELVRALTIILSACAWSGIVAAFFKKKYPVLDGYVTWSLCICAGFFVAWIVGWLLYSIGSGAFQTLTIYRDLMNSGKVGLIGRVLWAIFFLLSFLVALCFIRL
jgi:hypothetical protein